MDEIGGAHDPFPLSRAGHFVGQPGQAALININAPNLGDGVLVHSRSSEVRLIIEPRKFDVKVAIRPLFFAFGNVPGHYPVHLGAACHLTM
jgi:hypothetical protein